MKLPNETLENISRLKLALFNRPVQAAIRIYRLIQEEEEIPLLFDIHDDNRCVITHTTKGGHIFATFIPGTTQVILMRDTNAEVLLLEDDETNALQKIVAFIK